MFPKYPYLDLSDRNLDFLTRAIREMENEVKNFVSLNAVKYANPIQWSIDRQYEKNTIVIDPLTGTAFISVQPVPNGISLTRTLYWTPVFDLSQFVTKAASNFANSYERDITTTATVATGAGDWVVWDSTLYVALTSIHAGDAYVVNGNIKRMTVEDFYDLLMETIRALGDRIDDEIENRQDADSALGGRIDDEIRDRQLADTALGGRIDDEIRDRQDADTAINGKIGNLDNLMTIDKSNLVNAINEVSRFGGIFINVKSFGAVGDGVTNDTAAIQDAIDSIGETNYMLYFPAGTYYITSPLEFPNNSGQIIGVGRMQSTILTGDCTAFEFVGAAGVSISNIGIRCKTQGSSNAIGIKLLNGCLRFKISEMFFYQNYCDIYANSSVTEITIDSITTFNWTRSSVFVGDTGYCGSINVNNSFFKTDHNLVTNGGVEIKFLDVGSFVGNTFITPLSNSVLIEPDTMQTASLLTFTNNCFDTSANGLQLKGNGTVTRIIATSNTIQELSNAGFIITNGNCSYVVINNNDFFNTPYGVNVDGADIDGCDISNNIFACTIVGLRLVGTTKGLKCNTNIFGTSKYGLTLPTGVAVASGVDGVAFGNMFNNVTTDFSNGSTDFTVYNYS